MAAPKLHQPDRTVVKPRRGGSALTPPGMSSPAAATETDSVTSLVGSQYCAPGVLVPVGGLADFINTGIADQTVDWVGRRSGGKSIVEVLIDELKMTPAHTTSNDRVSVGFLDGHPGTDDFLGVPIRVRDQILESLRLTDHTNGEFSIDDDEPVASVAASAVSAVGNAQLYREAEHRQEWQRASRQIIQQIHAEDGGDPLRHLAERILKIVDAELVSAVMCIPDSARLTVAVAVGDGASRLTELSFPAVGSVAARVIANGRPLLIDDIDTDPDYWVHLSKAMAIGPVMVLPLLEAGLFKGVLVVGRRQGRPVFTDVDLRLSTMFVSYTAVALEITASRADQERLLLLEERDRIARDLHDHVVQRIFATGLSLQSIAAADGSGPVADRLHEQIESLDDTIRQIRTVIYHLQQPAEDGPTNARARLLVVIEQASVGLPQPCVRFIGPIDIAATGDIVEELLAVVREMLTNVAKHAHASSISLTITATADLRQISVTTTDDGSGMSESGHRGGLKNLQERARRYGGELMVTPAAQLNREMPPTGGGGTRCHWSANINR
ncbi:MAG: GAF domain-containing protein [Antricoccus sp.]